MERLGLQVHGRGDPGLWRGATDRGEDLRKGIVQNIYPFNDGAALKYTIARVLLPSGR